MSIAELERTWTHFWHGPPGGPAVGVVGKAGGQAMTKSKDYTPTSQEQALLESYIARLVENDAI